MLESTTYMDSVAKGELVPQIMLNPFVNPDEDWTLLEVAEILQHQYNQWNGDMSHNGVSISGIASKPQIFLTLVILY